LSEEQLKVAQKRSMNNKKVDFKLQDYRTITQKYDRIFSVGM
jgi:cyclopropane fatty-acyl-phospholipid synthase-like methyltransferase